MGEASLNDLTDVINTIEERDMKDFIKAMGLSFPEDDDSTKIVALVVLQTWKEKQGRNATRINIIQALKRLKNKNVVNEMEERWKGKSRTSIFCINTGCWLPNG